MFGFLFKKSKGLDKEGKVSLKQSTKDLLTRRNSASSAVITAPTSSVNNGNELSNAASSNAVTLPCSNSSPAIITSSPVAASSPPSTVVNTSTDKDDNDGGNINQSQSWTGNQSEKVVSGSDSKETKIADKGGGEEKPLQMSIPTVVVSSSDCLNEVKNDDFEKGESGIIKLENLKRGDSEEERCSSSQSSNSVSCGDYFGTNKDYSSAGDEGLPNFSSLTNLLTCSTSGEEICSSTSGICLSGDDPLRSLMSDTEIEFIDENLDDACSSNELNFDFQENKFSKEEKEVNKEGEGEERELKDTERKAMVQLEELRSKLISKETELSLLQADINMLAVDRDNKIMEIEGMSTQLKALRDENDLSLRRIQRLESELEDLRQKNNQLSDDLLKKAEQLRCYEAGSMGKLEIDTGDLQLRIKEYESKLRDLESEKNQIIKDRKTYEIEREEEIKALQEALDDSVAEKNRLQNKFNRDFAELQGANTSLMDDFEWKLRQIESNCKKKIQEKDKQIQEKIKEVKDNMTDEFRTEKERLEQERHQLKEQLRNVAHLKSHEAELTQLRGLTQEQDKSLRAASRQIEQLKLNERIMQDELRALRKLLDQEKAHLTVIQNSAQRRIDFHEENTKSKLEKQKNELQTVWEDKLRDECTRLKRELNIRHTEEKQLALETMELQKDQEMTSARQKWEKQIKELKEEIVKLKDAICKKEIECDKEISRATTIADRENLDLRRQVDKLSMAHLEELEQLRESHSEEMENLKQRHDTTAAQLRKLEKKLIRYANLYGYIGSGDFDDDDQNNIWNEINEDSTKGDKEKPEDGDEEEEKSEYEDEEEEEEEDEEKDAKETDKKHDSKDSTESLEEIEDSEEDGEQEEEDDLLDTTSSSLNNKNKNEIYVVEVKDTPPNNLTVPEIRGGEDDDEKKESRTVSTPSSSYISTSPSNSPSESESDVKKPSLQLLAVIPIASFLLFQSILVAIWTFLVLLIARLLINTDNSNSTNNPHHTNENNDENHPMKNFSPISNHIISTPTPGAAAIAKSSSSATAFTPNYHQTLPNPPVRRKSQGRSLMNLDGTFPRLAPYGKSRSGSMTSCTLT